jgi:hypothetical protein
MREFFAHNQAQNAVDDPFNGIMTSFLVCDGRDSNKRLTLGLS